MACSRCGEALSASILAVPENAGARAVRIGFVVLLDLALAAGGISFGLRWWRAQHPSAEPAPQTTIATAPSPPAPTPPPPVRHDTGPGRIVVPEPKFVDGHHPIAPVASSAAPVAVAKKPDAGILAVLVKPDAAPPPRPDAAPVAIVLPPDAAPAVVPPPPPPPDAAPPPPPPPDAAPAGPDEETVAFSADAVREVVNDHQDQIQGCYSRAAKATSPDNPLAGQILVHLQIDPGGKASDVHVVQNDTGSDELATCLTGLLGSWKFPGPGKDPVPFDWPFIFQGH